MPIRTQLYSMIYSIAIMLVLFPWFSIGNLGAMDSVTEDSNGCSLLADITAVNSGLWNDPNTWSGQSIPTLSDDVTIPANEVVTLLGDCKAKTIRVQGKLNALQDNPNADFHLTTEYLLVSGTQAILDLGTTVSPYIANGTITLIGEDDNDDIMGMGDKFIIFSNGANGYFHGKPKTSWAQLESTVSKGSSQMTLDETVNWDIGDKIVVASSTSLQRETETRIITSISNDGRTIQLNAPLLFDHYADILSYVNGKTGNEYREWEVDMRTEVGLLSRNLTIEGDQSSEVSGFGGHFMIMPSSTVRMNHTELYRMGQQYHIARYPFHWHLCGDASEQYIRNCSIHKGYNRAIVIHGTDNTLVESNVLYDIWGSALFLEDGVETGNQLLDNLILGVYVPPHAPEDNDFDSGSLPGGIDNPLGIVPSDYQIHRFRVVGPAGIWITNPDNTIEGNAVAGCDGVAYWYGLPESPTGLSVGAQGYEPRKTNIKSFRHNRAHTVASGLHFDHSHNQEQDAIVDAPYLPEEDGVGVWAKVSDFTCYKMNRGWWTRTSVGQARNIEFRDIKLLDCKDEEMIISSWKGRMYDCLFVGNSPNGSPDNRIVDYTAAMAFYDGNYEIYDSHFQDFDKEYLSVFAWFGGASDRCNDFFKDCTFDNVNYYNDFAVRRSVSLSSIIRDVDGSITKTANGTIVPEHPYLIDDVHFERLQPNNIGYATTLPAYAGKVELLKTYDNDVNSMYSEWENGHAIHGSVWGASNQFTVFPTLNRLYRFRWLDYIAEEIELSFRYVQNNDHLDLVMVGSPVRYTVQGASQAESVLAVHSATNDSYYWDNTNNELHIRLFAEDDPTPNDEEYTAQKIVILKSSTGQSSQAIRNFAQEFRPYNHVPHQVNSIIESEHFDYGGQFKAYLEMSKQAPNPVSDISNENNRFTPLTGKSDKVRQGEIVEFALSEGEYSNDHAIRDIYTGEYWNYSISVQESMQCELQLKYKSSHPNNGILVKVDGDDKLNTTWSPTGSRAQLATVGSIFLTAGDHVITLEATSSDFSLDWFTFVEPGSSFLDDMAGDYDGDGKSYTEEVALGRNPFTVCDHAFEFNTDNNQEDWWNVSELVGIDISDGTFKASTATEDASINSPYFTFSGDSIQYLQIRMRANKPGLVELFWETDLGSYTSDRRQAVAYDAMSEWQIITFDLSQDNQWRGQTIYQYRLDPLTAIADIEIDWIRGSCSEVVNFGADQDGDGKSYSEELMLGRDPYSICDLGYEFNTDGDIEDWTNIFNINNDQVQSGAFGGNTTTQDASFNSPKMVIDGDSIKAIQIRMKASQNGLLEFFWANELGSYNGTRRLEANYTGNGNYQLIVLDLSEHPQWVGRTIENFRIDPIDKIATFSIDYIRGSCISQVNTTGDSDGDGKDYVAEVQNARNPFTVCDLGFDFDQLNDFEQWSFNSVITNTSVSNGVFSATSSTADPNMNSPVLAIDGDSIKIIEVRLKANTNGLVEFFWANENGGFDSSRRLSADYTGSGSWQTITFSLGNHSQWDNKTINRLRLDPIGQATPFSVDYIRGHCCFTPSNCDPIPSYIDNDFDGFIASTDCNDNNPEINPGAIEIPNNNIDEDCDGIAQIVDLDGDGYNSDQDCDDSDPNANPSQVEIPNNTVDEDCDGIVLIIDNDMDGYHSDEDCDDENPNINPEAIEIPNNTVDEDCDGTIAGQDSDNDGFFDGEDCDDNDPTINPDAEELANNTIDENCDGIILIIDADNDGYHSDEDCDETNPQINPGATEIANNNIDEDCDGFLVVIDLDSDGFNSDEDCDDANPNINPSQVEIPNNAVDEDCDGIVLIIDNDMDGYHSDEDCNDDNPSINPGAIEIANNSIDENCDGIIAGADMDGDGFNAEDDCNDNDANVNPEAPELCDGIDNNCDGNIDEGFNQITYYQDADNDGFGNINITITACQPPIGYVLNNTDCDDADNTINPDAMEIPNNTLDENCDNLVLVIDEDMDGYNSDVDCNDNDASTNPSAIEICDGIDNNCDGAIDEGWSVMTYYQDADADGFGDLNVTFEDCSPPSGYVDNSLDCDDSNPNANPNAVEIPNNGIDENCDGMDLTSSIEQNGSSDQISLFPNPFEDELNIITSYEDKMTIYIYDSHGNLALNRSLFPIERTIKLNLVLGLYVICLFNSAHELVHTDKFVRM